MHRKSVLRSVMEAPRPGDLNRFISHFFPKFQLKFIIANEKCMGGYPSKDNFYELAENTNGEVYTIEPKEALLAIKDLTTDLVEGATILDVALSKPGNHSLEVHVDSTIDFLKVSLTGETLTLQVIDPSNKVSDKARVVLDLERVKTVHVDSPEPGVWRIESSSSTKNQVKVSGNSKVSFVYGFSLHKPGSLADTGAFPYNSHSNYLGLACSDPLVNMEKVRVFSPTSDQTVALKIVDYTNMSICAFDPPKEAFKVEVIGKDANGNRIQRLLPTRFYLKNVTKPQYLGGELEQFLTIAPDNIQDLDCIMAGDPEPDMRWFKNGQQMEEKLNVLAVDDESADYKCFGENDLGSASVLFHVNKGQAPEVVESRLKDKNGSIVLFTADSTDYLICPVKGHPKPTISWFKDDEPVTGKSLVGVHIESDGEVISFRGLDNHPSNMGNFRCVAENNKGSIWLHFRVEFNEAPRINQCDKYDFNPDSNTYLEKVFVKKGGRAELDCDVTGNPRPEITWFKEVNPVDGSRQKLPGNGKKVNFTSIEKHSVYICGAQSINGYLEKRFQVDIKSAPKFKNPLDERLRVALHSEVTIKCDTEYEVDVNVLWLKNETEIMDNKRYVYSKDRLRLKVLRASRLDEAFYKCSLSNSDGKAVKGFNVTLIKVIE